jgi:hypothetical protein
MIFRQSIIMKIYPCPGADPGFQDVIDYTVHKGPIYDLLDDVTLFCFLVDNPATGKWQLTIFRQSIIMKIYPCPGADPGFQVRGRT